MNVVLESMGTQICFELKLPGEVELLKMELSCWDVAGLLRGQRDETGSGYESTLCLLRMFWKNQSEKERIILHEMQLHFLITSWEEC